MKKARITKKFSFSADTHIAEYIYMLQYEKNTIPTPVSQFKRINKFTQKGQSQTLASQTLFVKKLRIFDQNMRSE